MILMKPLFAWSRRDIFRSDAASGVVKKLYGCYRQLLLFVVVVFRSQKSLSCCVVVMRLLGQHIWLKRPKNERSQSCVCCNGKQPHSGNLAVTNGLSWFQSQDYTQACTLIGSMNILKKKKTQAGKRHRSIDWRSWKSRSAGRLSCHGGMTGSGSNRHRQCFKRSCSNKGFHWQLWISVVVKNGVGGETWGSEKRTIHEEPWMDGRPTKNECYQLLYVEDVEEDIRPLLDVHASGAHGWWFFITNIRLRLDPLLGPGLSSHYDPCLPGQVGVLRHHWEVV